MSVGGQVRAANYDYLILKQTDGTETALSSASLKITFSNGNLVATSSEGTTTLSLSSLSTMQFSETGTTGIAEATTSQTAVSVAGRTVQVQAAEGTPVRIVNLSGMVVAEGVTANSGKQAFGGQLATGIYVVKVGEKTTKIQVR